MYQGLPDKLRREVIERDQRRCRWCGATNRGGDVHHIRYRRGSVDDIPTNLICLCRGCHDFVHGRKRPNGSTISKALAQQILYRLVAEPGVTGMSLHRQVLRESNRRPPLTIL